MTARNTIHCVMPWVSLVLYGGSEGIRPCYWSKTSIEPQNYNSLEEIWNGEKIFKLREYFLKGKIDKVCPQSCPHLRYGSADLKWLISTYASIPKSSMTINIRNNLTKIIKILESRKSNKLIIISKPIIFELYKNSFKCNLNCKFCWEKNHVISSLGFNPAIFSDYLVFLKYVREIQFWGGEPLINAKDEIMNVLENFREKQLILTTNGLLINEIDLDRYVSRFNWIKFSLNGASKSVHERVNHGSNWEKVIENIMFINKLKKIKRITYPKLLITMVITPLNYTEIIEFIRFAKEMNCFASFWLCRGNGYTDEDHAYALRESLAVKELLVIIDKAICEFGHNPFHSLDIVRQEIRRNHGFYSPIVRKS